MKFVAKLPVLTVARLLNPRDEPARIVNAVAAQPETGAFHVRITDWPLTIATRPLGASGTDRHGTEPPPPTVSTTSFDGPLNSPRFTALTRTK